LLGKRKIIAKNLFFVPRSRVFLWFSGRSAV